jgi:hypothetical protein
MTKLDNGQAITRLGAYTGPESGVAADDNVKAANDLILADGVEAATQATLEAKCISKDLASLASGANVLFTVAGGPIKLVEIVAICTGDIQAQSTLIGYNVAVTTPAGDVPFGTDGTALEINADAAGTLYTWDGVIAADLVATTAGVAIASGSDVTNGLIIPPGDIELTSSATSTGTLTVSMRYLPLSPDSVVS